MIVEPNTFGAIANVRAFSAYKKEGSRRKKDSSTARTVKENA